MEPDLVVVNYDIRDAWYGIAFPSRTAVVDFLFHPKAAFWAVHHPTAFPNSAAAAAFRSEGETSIYDPSAKSCAGLLQHWLDGRGHAESRFSELAEWAQKIDSASYDSVEESFSLSAPALTLSAALVDASGSQCISIVQRLGSRSLADVAADPDLVARANRNHELNAQGLAIVKDSLHVRRSGIAVFSVDPAGARINRYSAFWFARDARYSAGLVTDSNGTHLSVMRNPWEHFESVHLGKLCSRFGGGGHQRVGAIRFRREERFQAHGVLSAVVEAIEAAEARVALHG